MLIDVEGFKINVKKEIKSIYKSIPRTLENPNGDCAEKICDRIIYYAKGKDKYKNFAHKELYYINGKLFYRTKAKPPYWEFKFIES